tara:strand:- start:57 stop:611 length:555 start_codon:yes stop_codon:yes gene_type:complete
MALWGHTSGTESKPNWLSDAEKTKTQAKPYGWELAKEVGSRTLREVLVAWSSSGLTTALGAADITDIDFNITAFDKSEGGTLSVTVVFNEAVDVTGTPQLTVVNDQRANHTLSYASGTGSNELVFTLAIAAANAATSAGDELSIGANAVALNGGTIKDTGTNTASTITNSGAIGTAAGTITVVA